MLVISDVKSETFSPDSFNNTHWYVAELLNEDKHFFYIPANSGDSLVKIVLNPTSNGFTIDYNLLSTALFDTIYDPSKMIINFIYNPNTMSDPFRMPYPDAFYREGEKCELTDDLIKERLDSVMRR